MGLDITAYSNLRYVGRHPGDDDPDHNYDLESDRRVHVEAYADAHFPHALFGVPNVQQKNMSGYDFLTAGCFELTEKTETHRFRAGSYSGYNQWRWDLADRFNPYGPLADPNDRYSYGPPAAEGDFYELIWFSDCEGTLSELVAMKLLGHFREHELEYMSAWDGDDLEAQYFRQRYQDWMRACELAADGGLIDFH